MSIANSETNYQSMKRDCHQHDHIITLETMSEDNGTHTSHIPTTTTTTNRVPTTTTSSCCNRHDIVNNITGNIFCGIIIIISVLLKVSGVVPLYERPIPYQSVDNGEYVRNLTNDQPLDGETISNVVLLVIGLFVPFVLQLSLSWKYRLKDDIIGTVFVYIVSYGVTSSSTEIIKLYAGYLRPVFYELCQPNDDYTACTNLAEEHDGRKSFPSGHASTAFCGLTLLTLFLHNRFGVPSIKSYTLVPATLDGETKEIKVTYKKNPLRYRIYSILSLLPMAIALFIAASRVHDNYHFPADVVGGSLLGGSISIFVHGVWMN